MNLKLIENWNSIIKNKNDIVYFLGDFSFGSHNQFLEKLNGHIILIKGNHDKNIKGILDNAILTYNNKKIFLTHYVESSPPINCDFVIQGHVHEKWKFKILNHIIIINASVEMWDYKPISIDQIFSYYNSIKNLNKNLKSIGGNYE